MRVVLVDDHALVRAGLRLLLERASIQVVAEAATRNEALRAMEDAPCDVALVDLHLGDDDGMAVVEAIHRSRPEVRLLVLTMHEDDGRVLEALRLGASGYVLKAASPSELLAAVQHVARGDSYIDPRVARTVVTEVRRGERALSDLDHELLRMLASGLNNKEIARGLNVSVATVKRNLSALFQRFRVKTRSGLVVEAMRGGLIAGQPTRPARQL